MFVIDSSVFLSYLFRDEKFHNDAKKFFQQIMDKKIKIFFPISVVCEILHVAYRKSGNLKIRDRLYGEFIKNPMFKIINNESSFLIYFSSHHHKFDIKSADCVVAVHALRLNMPLVTLDQGLIKGAEKYIRTVTPMEAIKQLQ